MSRKIIDDLQGGNVRVIRHPNPNAKNIVTVDADTWAASGGTAGIFGKAWREGRLKIVLEETE